jgi:hypothetical protein
MIQTLPASNASFAERKGKSNLHRPSLDPVVEGEATQATNSNTISSARALRLRSIPSLGKQRSQYLEGKYDDKSVITDQVVDHVRSHEMLYAEVKTNVIVRSHPLPTPARRNELTYY